MLDPAFCYLAGSMREEEEDDTEEEVEEAEEPAEEAPAKGEL